MRLARLLLLGRKFFLRPGIAILPPEETTGALVDQGVTSLPSLDGDCFMGYDGRGQVDGIPRSHLHNKTGFVKHNMPAIPMVEDAKDQNDAEPVSKILYILVGLAHRLGS